MPGASSVRAGAGRACPAEISGDRHSVTAIAQESGIKNLEFRIRYYHLMSMLARMMRPCRTTDGCM
jgi:hypothetical protein